MGRFTVNIEKQTELKYGTKLYHKPFSFCMQPHVLSVTYTEITACLPSRESFSYCFLFSMFFHCLKLSRHAVSYFCWTSGKMTPRERLPIFGYEHLTFVLLIVCLLLCFNNFWPICFARRAKEVNLIESKRQKKGWYDP